MFVRLLFILRDLAFVLFIFGGFYLYSEAQRAVTDPYAPCAKYETPEARQICKNQIDFAMSGAGW